MSARLGTLYLIPCTLGDTPPDQVLPQHVISVARKLQNFVVEQPKTARQFLSALKPEQPIQALHFATLNEHTAANELPELLAPLLAGHDVGVISEAGCPGIADPGANLVNLAHRNGIRGRAAGRPFLDLAGVDGFRIEWTVLRLSRLLADSRSREKQDDFKT